MTALKRFCRRLFNFLIQRRHNRARFQEEIEAHLVLLTEQNIRGGMAPTEAGRQARLQFGPTEAVLADCHDEGTLPLLEDLGRDVRFALRLLRKSPFFTVIAVSVLSLGIGANTAIFSIIDAVFLRALPFADADRLVSVWVSQENAGRNHSIPLSYPKYEFVCGQQTVFEDLGANAPSGFTLTGRGEPAQVSGAFASARFFQTLGVRPSRGRLFLPADDLPGGPKVVVVTEKFWQKHGGDPALVGQSLTLNGDAYAVVGIVPTQPSFPLGDTELFAPRVFDIPDPPPTVIQQGGDYILLTARLKPGVTLARANEELSLLTDRYRQAFPNHIDTKLRLWTHPLQEEIVGDSRPMFYTLSGAVGCVLLIACVNVANLLLARQAGRRKEIAIRAALGAGRGRLARQFLTESLLLTLIAGTLGTALALWCVDLAHGLGPGTIPRADEVRLDGTTLAFALGVSLVVGLVLGVVPALHAGRGEPGHTLQRADSRGGTSGVHQGRTRAALLVAQVAISLVLLAGTGLLITSLWQLRRVRLGYNPDALVTVDLNLPAVRYPTVEKRADFYARLVEQLDAIPGVRRAGASTGGPLGNYLGMYYSLAGQPVPPLEQKPHCRYAVVTPDYFATMQTPLVQGRMLNDRDRADSPPVMMVNETWAKKVFPDGNVLGQLIRCTNANPTVTEIVGVVADAHTGGLAQPTQPEMYFSTYQRGEMYMAVYVRADSTEQARSLGSAVSAAVHTVNSDQSVSEVQPMQAVIDRSVADRRLMAGLLAGFAGLALVLAATGIYGVTAYGVAQRTREIGIRMALGAQRRDVFSLVILGGMKLIFAGVAVGVLGALGLTRLLAGLLYGVGTSDPLTFAAVILVLTSVALLASYLPARQATRIDPLTALREE